MSHGRHDYPTAIHLVRVQGRAGQSIFFPAEIVPKYGENIRERAPDLRVWESLIARACDRHAAKVHGYTWLPNEAILLFQRFAVPLRNILPSLLGGYSRYLHGVGRVPSGKSPYLCRCRSIEVTKESIPYALRHLYAWPGKVGLCTRASQYAFCSHSLHFAKLVPSWFETREFLAHVGMRGYVGQVSVEKFLAKAESPRHAGFFERLSARTAQIAGEAVDVEESLQTAMHSSPAPSVEEVEGVVATLLGRESRFSERVLAVALTTWYATRMGAATLAQMGHWFHLKPTTLRADIESHRRRNPALFDLHAEEFLELVQTRRQEAEALHGTARRPDVNRIPVSVALPRKSESRRVRRVSNSSRDGTPVQKEAAELSRAGPSHSLGYSELASSACVISKEDLTCRVGSCGDPDLAILRRRVRRPVD